MLSRNTEWGSVSILPESNDRGCNGTNSIYPIRVWLHVTDQPGQAALVAALKDWRRHSAAFALILGAFGLAIVLGTEIAYYGAALVAFAVWMAWFVLTTIEWLRRADF